MDFDLNAEDCAVIESVRALVASRPAPMRKAHEEPGDFDEATWTELSRELGMVAMALPGSVGGDDGGAVLAGLVVRELGAALYSGPYLSCLLGATILADADDERIHELVGHTISGISRPTYAPAAGSQVRARVTPRGWLLDGQSRAVLDATTASHVVVDAADDACHRAHFVVDLTAVGVEVDRVRSFDVTRETGVVTFDAAPAIRVGGDEGTARELWVRGIARAKAFVASEQVGGVRAVLHRAVEHAKVRHQFGRPIGSFQAVKHQLADVLVDAELSEVTVDHVLCLLDAGRPVGELAASALAMSSDAYSDAALVALHAHGGLGITWESRLHLHVRRAKSTAALLGNPAYQRRLVLADLGW